jgi:hypothetical protein
MHSLRLFTRRAAIQTAPTWNICNGIVNQSMHGSVYPMNHSRRFTLASGAATPFQLPTKNTVARYEKFGPVDTVIKSVDHMRLK